jgi:hypothetical protein
MTINIHGGERNDLITQQHPRTAQFQSVHAKSAVDTYIARKLGIAKKLVSKYLLGAANVLGNQVPRYSKCRWQTSSSVLMIKSGTTETKLAVSYVNDCAEVINSDDALPLAM